MSDFVLPVNQIIQGDCLEVMRGWPDKCVDLIVTSPPYSVIRIYREMARGDIVKEHPARYPVELPSHIIQAYSDSGDIILDPFAGSGTTLVAAKQLGRKYIGIEISGKYVAICKERLKQEQLPL